ncbi:N-acetylmuramoyl-L-alanine amidase [Cognatiyoonia sp. IB215182]|uniref:N-acetylmuramoyl-L-alanine amidase n=1 Tax=Cognatiyoonia sp. IB215182 TaxID=3097353 RepID=UPI002A16E5CA|nr:N-acetylmuramoyl-L-alanine amidase [Cognatiyoonia sp. IB215182]MDX8353332.1 N-acetylmuramoyl-L-alanine amidase [Cognatiyoonia sp. IB215182]
MIRWLILWICLATGAKAQVTIDPDRSVVRDGWWSLRVELALSDVTPYRVFTLDNPRRLIIDFEDVIWEGIDGQKLRSGDRAMALRIDPLHSGWSRMVVDLAEPLNIVEAGLRGTGAGADLTVVLEQVSGEEFAAAAGAPPDLGRVALAAIDRKPFPPVTDTDDFVVVLDPGHGGIDPGAERGGLNEAELMLTFAEEVAAELNALPGISVVMTRDANTFVPLFTRMSVARAAGADLFISLHADALVEDEARGASVYTLSRTGEERAGQQVVERHERDDLLEGLDLRAQGDQVAAVLMDLARAETGPQGSRFAETLVSAMRAEGVYLNSRPRREGRFAVLSAADFPGVLLEAGFLSNAEDRAVLQSAEGRARIARAVAAAVDAFRDQAD